MFKINRRIDYAVRVMLCLAKREPGSRLATQLIQEEMRIPRPFLRRIIADLSRVGMIRTFAGPNGGVELARQPEKIHLRQIWEAIEGPILISDCLEGVNSCPLETGCPVNRRWKRLQALILSELESITLDGLVEDAKQLSQEAPIQALIPPALVSISGKA